MLAVFDQQRVFRPVHQQRAEILKVIRNHRQCASTLLWYLGNFQSAFAHYCQ